MPRKKKMQDQLAQEDIVRAATNDPEMSEVEVVLGDRTFKIIDLPYDDYVMFLSELQPLLEVVASKIGGAPFEDSEELSISSLLGHCAKSLPRMAYLSLKQTDPEITVEEVKRLGKSPFKIAQVVLAQINQNKMVSEIASFFAQLIPVLRIGKTALTQEVTL